MIGERNGVGDCLGARSERRLCEESISTSPTAGFFQTGICQLLSKIRLSASARKGSGLLCVLSAWSALANRIGFEKSDGLALPRDR